MAIHLESDCKQRLLLITMDGIIRDADMLDFDTVLRQNADFKAGYYLLFDCTKVASADMLITAKGIYALKELTVNDTNMVAIVASEGVPFGMARMFEIVANWCFERVRTFTTMEPALQWLGVAQTSGDLARQAPTAPEHRRH